MLLGVEDVRERKDEIISVLKRRYLEGLIPKVDEIEELDKKWRQVLGELNKLRAERNRISKEIGKLYREGKEEEAESLKKTAAELDERITELEKKESGLKKLIDENLRYLPNFLHPAVIQGPDDSHNKAIRFWGLPKVGSEHVERFNNETGGFDIQYEVVQHDFPHHYDLVERLDVADTERAGKTAGSRFYYEKGALVFLDIALARWSLEELMKKGFEPIIPPYMMRKKVEEAATYFTDFEDVIYKVEGEDLYLIPTAEHALLGYHVDEIFEVGSSRGGTQDGPPASERRRDPMERILRAYSGFINSTRWSSSRTFTRMNRGGSSISSGTTPKNFCRSWGFHTVWLRLHQGIWGWWPQENTILRRGSPARAGTGKWCPAPTACRGRQDVQMYGSEKRTEKLITCTR